MSNASRAYHPSITATLSLAALLILLMTGCEEPRATSPQLPPAATVQSEPETTPESVTEAPATSGEITGKVIHILDDDTIYILTAEKTTIRIRMNGIDGPEKRQTFGNTANEFLSESIGGFDVRVVTHGKDRYGRVIGDVYSLEDADRLPRLTSENVSMVVNGLAWHYVKYAPDNKELAGAEKWAREQRLRL
ncbi:MAG: thermonuclease family protein [Planctomycetaceae bacterium]|nr:thermonuclease family protein [Planctomycetaceae bacterium]